MEHRWETDGTQTENNGNLWKSYGISKENRRKTSRKQVETMENRWTTDYGKPTEHVPFPEQPFYPLVSFLFPLLQLPLSNVPFLLPLSQLRTTNWEEVYLSPYPSPGPPLHCDQEHPDALTARTPTKNHVNKKGFLTTSVRHHQKKQVTGCCANCAQTMPPRTTPKSSHEAS